jgi:hypothetical protein
MLVVVGGHSKHIGKTSAVCGLIRRMRQRGWAALKITQHSHGTCHPCECAPDTEGGIDLSEEYTPNKTDTGRYLGAGARRSFWLRAPAGRLFEAADLIRRIIDQNENTIVESNSILEFFDPDVFLMLLDFGCEDFKASSLQYMDRADAYLVVDRGINAHMFPQIAQGWLEGKPQFLVKPPNYATSAVATFVSSKFPLAAEPAG